MIKPKGKFKSKSLAKKHLKKKRGGSKNRSKESSRDLAKKEIGKVLGSPVVKGPQKPPKLPSTAEPRPQKEAVPEPKDAPADPTLSSQFLGVFFSKKGQADRTSSARSSI
jgi:hypothetical protein